MSCRAAFRWRANTPKHHSEESVKCKQVSFLRKWLNRGLKDAQGGEDTLPARRDEEIGAYAQMLSLGVVSDYAEMLETGVIGAYLVSSMPASKEEITAALAFCSAASTRSASFRRFLAALGTDLRSYGGHCCCAAGELADFSESEAEAQVMAWLGAACRTDDPGIAQDPRLTEALALSLARTQVKIEVQLRFEPFVAAAASSFDNGSWDAEAIYTGLAQLAQQLWAESEAACAQSGS